MHTANIIAQLAANGEELYGTLCKVVSVSEGNATCNAVPIDGGAELKGVRLNPDPNKSGVTVYPKNDSVIIVGYLSKNEAHLIHASEYEKIEIKNEQVEITLTTNELTLKIGEFELSIKNGKLGVKNTLASLADILNGMVNGIKGMVLTGVDANTIPVTITSIQTPILDTEVIPKIKALLN